MHTPTTATTTTSEKILETKSGTHPSALQADNTRRRFARQAMEYPDKEAGPKARTVLTGPMLGAWSA
jgi:hypothetical protein